MSVLRYFSVLRAWRDVRRLFLSRRKPYEIWFLLLAMVLTVAIILAFAHDSNIKRPYKENIIYVESWPLNRSEAEILAQQKVDAAKKAKEQAAIEKAEKERQAQFQRLDNTLSAWGM
jgi:hypothetical protein